MNCDFPENVVIIIMIVAKRNNDVYEKTEMHIYVQLPSSLKNTYFTK